VRRYTGRTMSRGRTSALARGSRCTLVALVGLLVCVVVPTAGLAQEASPPRAGIETTERDLGVVGLGTNPSVEFTIANTGGSVLELTAPAPPPALQLTHIDRTIAPGRSGVVRLAIDTFKAGQTSRWALNVTTNDAERSTLAFVVKADVRAFLALAPAAARFSFVQYGPEGGTSHVVAAVDEADFAVTGVESRLPFIRAAFSKVPADKLRDDLPGTTQWRIDLTIAADAPVGPIADYVIVQTDHPAQPRAFISVSGFVRPMVAVTPRSVHVAAALRPDGAPLASLNVQNFAAEAITLTSATTDVAGLALRIETLTEGHEWRVELRGTEAARPGPLKGVIRLRTGSAKVPEIEVPLSGELLAR
jgi:hypothetical protein